MNLKEQISNTFTQCLTNNCLEDINSSSFEVVDDKQNSPCRSLTDGKFGQFKIENPDKYLLHFLKIDHCILFEQDGKKCDFAVFNADELIFVELKTIEKNSSNEHGKRNQKKRDAYIQLENTLETFKNEKIDLSSYQNNQKLFVIASVLDYNLSITKMPTAKTGSQNAQLRFFNEYRATLMVENTYKFAEN